MIMIIDKENDYRCYENDITKIKLYKKIVC